MLQTVCYDQFVKKDIYRHKCACMDMCVTVHLYVAYFYMHIYL